MLSTRRVGSAAVIGAALLQAACGAEVQEKLGAARIAANEASAVASLRVIASGQVVYASSCSGGGFAVSLQDLARPPKTGGDAFVPADLAGETVTKSGYKISVSKDRAPDVTAQGSAAETCNGSANQPASSFFASAEPETPGATGSRYFAVDGRAIVFASANPIANPIVQSATVTPLQ